MYNTKICCWYKNNLSAQIWMAGCSI